MVTTNASIKGKRGENIVRKFVKGFTPAEKEDDLRGIDGYWYGYPVQIKWQNRVEELSSIYYEIEKRPFNGDGLPYNGWRETPRIAEFYFIVSECYIYKFRVSELEDQTNYHELKEYPTSRGYVIPLPEVNYQRKPIQL